MYHPECILCGECVDSCPKKAIQFQFGKTSSHLNHY
ncbi:4Fe-4S binding protein [Neobacillus cucumis]